MRNEDYNPLWHSIFSPSTLDLLSLYKDGRWVCDLSWPETGIPVFGPKYKPVLALGDEKTLLLLSVNIETGVYEVCKTLSATDQYETVYYTDKRRGAKGNFDLTSKIKSKINLFIGCQGRKPGLPH